jgi:hypothetical protein
MATRLQSGVALLANVETWGKDRADACEGSRAHEFASGCTKTQILPKRPWLSTYDRLSQMEREPDFAMIAMKPSYHSMRVAALILPMPLSKLVDQTPDFILDNVSLSCVQTWPSPISAGTLRAFAEREAVFCCISATAEALPEGVQGGVSELTEDFDECDDRDADEGDGELGVSVCPCW